MSIVRKLQTILNAPRVVAWGGSGGGFASIRIVKDIPDAIALAWNSQTDIAKYVQEYVHRYLRIAFPALSVDGPLPLSIVGSEEFRAGYGGKILYEQEKTDRHSNVHLEPFLESFCGKELSDITSSSTFSGYVSDHLYLHLDHWGHGDVPPGKDVLANVLWKLSDANMCLEQGGILMWPSSPKLWPPTKPTSIIC